MGVQSTSCCLVAAARRRNDAAVDSLSMQQLRDARTHTFQTACRRSPDGGGRRDHPMEYDRTQW